MNGPPAQNGSERRTAAPNSLVTNTAQRNDFDWSTTPYGYPDANADFYLIGSMGPGDIGTWTEVWRVSEVEIPPTLTIPVLASPYPSVTEDPIPIIEENWAHALDRAGCTAPSLDFDVLEDTGASGGGCDPFGYHRSGLSPALIYAP